MYFLTKNQGDDKSLLSRIRPVFVATLLLTGCASHRTAKIESGSDTDGITIPLLQKIGTGTEMVTAGNVQKLSLPSAGRRLQISKVVEIALTENLETRISKVREREAEAEIELEQGAFDPEIASDFSTPTEGSSGGGYSLDVNKRFKTGTQLRIESGSSYDEDFPIEDGFSGSSSSDLGFRLRQPLLRGAGSKYNQSGIERANLIAVAADIRTQAQIYQILREVESAYWSASTFQALVLAKMNSVSRNRSLVDDVNARKELGTATSIDVLEAEASLAEAQLELVSAQKMYRDEVDRIQVLLGMNLTNGHMDWEFEYVTTGFDRKTSPSEKEIFDNAIENAPEIALLINDVEQRKIESFRAEKEKLPRLDLELDTIRRDSTTGGDPWETIGLVRVSVPLGNREREALYDQAESRLEASKLSKEEGELKLQQQIFEITRRITSGKEELEVAQQALKVNEAKWTEQLARSKEGLVSTRELRESEAELREAEVSENTARLKLILAWSYLSQLDGSIASRLGVSVVSN